MKLQCHDDWLSAMAPLRPTSKARRELARSITYLRTLVSRIRRTTRTSIGQWHLHESTGYFAYLIEESGDVRRASKVIERSARECGGQAIYFLQCAEFRFQEAANLAERSGQPRRAAYLRRRAAELSPLVAVMCSDLGPKRSVKASN